jgi:hypothetical protein
VAERTSDPAVLMVTAALALIAFVCFVTLRRPKAQSSVSGS